METKEQLWGTIESIIGFSFKSDLTQAENLVLWFNFSLIQLQWWVHGVSVHRDIDAR